MYHNEEPSSGTLAPNSLAFIALCNEYCVALESASQSERTEFIDEMLRLLPRIYISATDLRSPISDDESYLEAALDEDYYEQIRRTIGMLMGEHDTYLEVFEQDMKYSDTPIGASISESLADMFQVMYNFLEMVKDAPTHIVEASLIAIKDDFESYWSQILCNVLRALNHLKYEIAAD